MNWKNILFMAAIVIIVIYIAKIVFSKWNVPLISPVVAGV